MMDVDVCAGTGGLLSHAPRRVQSMLILNDAWQVEGVTRMFQDSVFMMPHLGVLSTVYRDAAWSIFEKDCLVRLGTCIAAVGTGELGDPVMSVKIEIPDGDILEEQLNFGEIKLIELSEKIETEVRIKPERGFDVGRGQGEELRDNIMGGAVGILLDARGRPLYLPAEDEKRKEILIKWFKTLKLYPVEALNRLV
jgi:hypothetical protein